MIGVGSFGRAILVRSRSDKKLYVMKRINMNDMSKEEQEGAMNEVNVLQVLKHPNIIAYHEYFKGEDGYLNIIMEHADGGDLFQRIRSASGVHFDESMILDWFVQTTLALKHVHDCNILHRDLKTQNIFLSSNNEVKLGDFGIAKILNSQTEFANTVIGTPYYLSPELCEDKPYNSKSDVWALGCVLYEVTTLKHAFNGQNLPSLVLKILKGNYPPIPAQYSDNLKNLIARALNKSPDLRPSMQEILEIPFLQAHVDKYKNGLPVVSRVVTSVSTTTTNCLVADSGKQKNKPQGEKKQVS
ncbi:hypothetical protein AKO1_012887 [Acrasis kona]|uniref:non-specific serine/threonine protein kinase n=1 Tax=Acrasis kona TaxID=1008807 RepID=A0AAW2YVI7_9EUKA